MLISIEFNKPIILTGRYDGKEVKAKVEKYTINVYDLGILLRGMFENTVDAVKRIDWMASKVKKVEESPEL